MHRNFNIYIGCDCDPDRRRFNKVNKDKHPSWEGVYNLPTLIESIRVFLLEKHNINFKITYFLRSDDQINHELGSFDHFFKEAKIGNLNINLNHDELGWHHHHFKIIGDEIKTIWDDCDWMVEHVERTYNNIKEYGIKSVHCGELILNHETLKAYDRVGIEFETSVLPGTGILKGNYNRYNFISNLSNRIYYPNTENYLSNEKPNLKIKIIPTNTVYSKTLNLVDIFGFILRTKSFNIKHFQSKKSFIPINCNPFLFRMFFKAFLKQMDTAHFSSYFHADELLSDNKKSIEAKLLFSTNYFLKNLDFMIKTLKSKGFEPVFKTFNNKDVEN